MAMDIGNLTQSLVATVVPYYSLATAYSDSILKLPNNEVNIVLGDDLDILHRLTKRGKSYTIPNGSTVTSRLLSIDGTVAYTTAITQVNTQKYADWDNSLINIQMTSSVISDIELSNPVWVRGRIPAILETEVTTNGNKEIFFAAVLLYSDIN